ncbi:hypothetical protein [Leuconostoc suionicum]|uniref:hypothetical protein n=1 Tax=Leuconostoc suionicum TaxID=1511761 RepID=UPI00300CBAC1
MKKNLQEFISIWNENIEHKNDFANFKYYHFQSAISKLQSQNKIFETYLNQFEQQFSLARESSATNYTQILIDSAELLPKIINVVIEQEIAFQNAKKVSHLETKRNKEILDVYVELLQSGFLDCSRIIASVLGFINGKQITLHNLSNGIDFISSPKRNPWNFKFFADLADIEIRNARDHNQVSYMDSQFEFKHKLYVDYYILENNTLNLINALKAFIVTFLQNCLDNHGDFSNMVSRYCHTDSLWYRWAVSTYLVNCNKFEITKVNGIYSQLSIEYCGVDATIEQRLWFFAAAIVSGYELIDNENIKSVYIAYTSPHALNSFGSLKSGIISNYLNGKISFDSVCAELWKNVFIPPVNNDSKMASAILEFSDIEHINYSVKDISDISVENIKRFKANVFLNESFTKSNIIKIALEVISELKFLVNMENPKTKIKFGSVPADVVYFNIYHDENDKNRSLFPENENFVANIQFYEDINFKILYPKAETLHLTESFIDDNVKVMWNPNQK